MVSRVVEMTARKNLDSTFEDVRCEFEEIGGKVDSVTKQDEERQAHLKLTLLSFPYS
jgi:acetyl-CoA carboxylase beta subunit